MAENYPWNFGDILDHVEQVVPVDRLALIHGSDNLDWGEFSRRSNNLAQHLLDLGAQPGDKIAYYMRNCLEYSIALSAGFKARLTHVNLNFRYVSREVAYLLNNSDATVLVYSSEFAGIVQSIKSELSDLKILVEVGDATPDQAVPGAHRFTDLAADGDGKPLDIRRRGDDLFFIYTGGTTGMPKGVMWRHQDFWSAIGAGGSSRTGLPRCKSIDEHLDRIRSSNRQVHLPLPPLMHGTGLVSAFQAMTHGGTCVTLPGKSFDPEEALQAVTNHGVNALTIVGDAFGRPLLECLDADTEGRFNLSTIDYISSSGVMWSKEVKEGLLKHNNSMVLVDTFSSSEAIGLGSSVMTSGRSVEVARFSLGPRCKVFDEDDCEIEAGSGRIGLVAVGGYLPLGYYKDEEKTRKTFREIDGVRYSVPGDWVLVEDDGSLTLKGRGSGCINTAGEKVFPEEVEEVIKQHSDVTDALVVGLPDERWGQSIVAVVELIEDAVGTEELRAFCKQSLAGYKVPKHIVVTDSLNRAPNGKPDYDYVRSLALANWQPVLPSS
ncbi:MAG: acyl-CoA synthetase [Rhodospirillaceae bacterium]|nr:acyl-CoA synthetase [Rhodospirillaceae bacterium]